MEYDTLVIFSIASCATLGNRVGVSWSLSIMWRSISVARWFSEYIREIQTHRAVQISDGHSTEKGFIEQSGQGIFKLLQLEVRSWWWFVKAKSEDLKPDAIKPTARYSNELRKLTWCYCTYQGSAAESVTNLIHTLVALFCQDIVPKRVEWNCCLPYDNRPHDRLGRQ